MNGVRIARIEEVDLTLTVSNGKGEAVFNYEGFIHTMRVKVPEKNALWTPDIVDDAGFPVWESPQGELTGKGACKIGEPVRRKNTIKFEGTNGDYEIRLMVDHGI